MISDPLAQRIAADCANQSLREVIAARLFLEPLPPEMQAPAKLIARKIEARYGAEALPRELAELRIPLIVEFKEPPETTLFHALFTSQPENLPL